MKELLVRLAVLASVVLLLGGVAPYSVQATTIRVTNLKDLVEQADRIFVGRCRAEYSERINNIPYSAYTFEVLAVIKGVPAG